MSSYRRDPTKLPGTGAGCAAERTELHSKAIRSSSPTPALPTRTSGRGYRHATPPGCRPCSSCLPAILESVATSPSAGSYAPSSDARHSLSLRPSNTVPGRSEWPCARPLSSAAEYLLLACWQLLETPSFPVTVAGSAGCWDRFRQLLFAELPY